MHWISAANSHLLVACGNSDVMQDKILVPYSTVQVVMVRGVISKWKQPIFYDFDKCVDAELFLDIENKKCNQLDSGCKHL